MSEPKLIRGEDLMRIALDYRGWMKGKLSDHLDGHIDAAVLRGVAPAVLPYYAEVLWAARDVIGDGGRELLRDICQWAMDLGGQGNLRGDRVETMLRAIVRDMAAGEAVAGDNDPAIDVRMIEPEPEPEPVELDELLGGL